MYIRSGTLLARPVDHPLDDTGLVVFAAPGWSR